MNAGCLAIALLGLAALPGCAQFEFHWIHRDEPIASERTAALRPGVADLQACLDALGAPQRVWESPQGIVLAYGWLDKFYWKFDVVVFGTDLEIDGRTVFSYNSTNDAYDGIVLVLGNDLRLKYLRRGVLADITRDLPRRPALVE